MSDSEVAAGERCTWMGVAAKDMTRRQLLAFIASLDGLYAKLAQQAQENTDGQ